TITATDPDAGQTLTYTIVPVASGGGADAAKFTIDANTGALSFVTPPNFESPSDAGANNVYDVIVQVSDGHGGTDTQAIAVTVTNVNEPPSGSNTARVIAEDTTYTFAAGDFGFSDPDAGDSLAAVRIDALSDGGTLMLAGNPLTVGQVIA